MQENKLIININKPLKIVFEFTINPQNTPTWIDFITEEQVDGEIEKGVHYVNSDKNGKVNEYIVSNFEPDKIFELTSISGNYTVRYTYKSLSANETEVEYYEWM